MYFDLDLGTYAILKSKVILAIYTPRANTVSDMNIFHQRCRKNQHSVGSKHAKIWCRSTQRITEDFWQK